MRTGLVGRASRTAGLDFRMRPAWHTGVLSDMSKSVGPHIPLS
jgi:hypothetical protein